MSARGGTNRRVLRSLDHMWTGTNEKFVNKLRPTHAQTAPAFVAPKDRIAFWNIVPGDVVKLRTGAVGHDEQNRQIRGEGIVTSVDRTTNRLWLRDLNEHHKRAPKNIKHAVPRLVDPEDASKGYSGNVTTVPRPVHYSKVMLKVPDTDMYASRIVRSKPYFDKYKGMYCWKRFAIVKATSAEALQRGEAVRRIEVPWPKVAERRRPFSVKLADGRTVEEETWVPWVPEDPVLLPMQKPRSTPAGEALAAEARAAWQQRRDAKLAANSDTLAAPSSAKMYDGFKTRVSIRPPPIAQAPMVSELIAMERERLAGFVNDEATQAHVQQGGAIFAPSDYLDVAPLTGPADGGEWGALNAASAGTDRDATGRLEARPGKADVDAMPLELLMRNDLVNERGLKWRMRRWKAAQAERKAQAAEKDEELKDLLKELDVLRV